MLGEEVLNGNLDGLELPCDFRPQISTVTMIFFGQAWRKSSPRLRRRRSLRLLSARDEMAEEAAAQSSDGMRKRLQQKENPRGGACI